jgi:hypothetical protein
MSSLRRLTHNTYDCMLTRCCNPNHKSYEFYGGRGIKICERWKDGFKYFLEDMGLRPSPKHTIDRINNDGGYEPGNCRWATWTEQRATRRPAKNEVIVSHEGRAQTLSHWALETGIKLDTLHSRLRLGWSVEKTLTTPVRTHPAQDAAK